MKKIKAFLRSKYSKQYKLLQKIFYILYAFVETRVLGTSIYEYIWRTRHIFKSTQLEKQWSEGVRQEFRNLIREGILSCPLPIESILDVGCGTGQYLFSLHSEFPLIKMYGIDINKQSIAFGRKKLREESIKNIMLINGSLDELKKIPAEAYDMVFTIMVLLYTGNDKIINIAKEMLRISKKRILLIEPHVSSLGESTANNLGFFHQGQWVRNYSYIFESLGVPKKNIICSQISLPSWSSSDLKSDYLIQIDL